MSDAKILQVAKQAAVAGGAIALRGWLSLDRKTVGYKKNAELVTKFDVASEAKIRSIIKQSFPDAYVVGEEKGTQGKTGEYQWYVDPIDGTTNFTIHSPEYSVSIGVYKNGVPEVGVVYVPVTKELFWAVRGKGAYCNGKRIKVSTARTVGAAVIDFEFSHVKKFSAGILKWFEDLTRGGWKLRHFGSDALSLCYVAAGRIEACVMAQAYPWDIAAGCLIATEAGALFTDNKGKAVTDLQQPMIACTPSMQRKLLQALK